MPSFFQLMNDHNDLSIDNAFDKFREILLNGFIPDTMIVAHPEGTWLLQRGQEPKLLGDEKDFDRIWQDALLRR